MVSEDRDRETPTAELVSPTEPCDCYSGVGERPTMACASGVRSSPQQVHEQNGAWKRNQQIGKLLRTRAAELRGCSFSFTISEILLELAEQIEAGEV